MPSRHAMLAPTATHRRRTPHATSRIAPLISDLAFAIQAATGPLQKGLDQARSTIHPVRTSSAFAEELALATAMVLPLFADRRVLLEELESVPFAGKWIRRLLCLKRPEGVARAVDALQQQISGRETSDDPHAWCELVLQAGDERRRRSSGFYLTPAPLARFVVASVSESLRSWCGLPRGLAEECSWGEAVETGAAPAVPAGLDPAQRFVSILDPAAGTGVFLSEVIRHLHREQTHCWKDEGLDQARREGRWRAFAERLVPRLRGVELMIGPYAVAHLHLRSVLRETGFCPAPGCVIPVYLGDALESPEAESVPQHATESWHARSSGATTVVLGNPPFAGIAPPAGRWMQELMADYKASVKSEERQIQRLSNLYVRFLRLVQWMAGRSGVLMAGLVTDRGWGEGVLFRDVRRSWLLQSGALRWVDLGGAEGGRASRGEADESLFPIRQPTAVTIARLRAARGDDPPTVASCSVRGTVSQKIAWMQRPLENSSVLRAQVPQAPHYRFAATPIDLDYAAWPGLLRWAGTGEPAKDRDHRYGTGVKTRHDDFVVGMTPSEAVERVRRVAWRTEDDGSLYEQLGLCTTAHFDLRRARKAAEQERSILDQLVKPLWFRPFDARFVVYDRAFVCEPKLRTMQHVLHAQNGSLAFLRQDRTGRASGYLASRGLIAKDMVSSRDDALVWPLFVYRGTQKVANISPEMIESLAACTGLRYGDDEDEALFCPWDVLGYIYAILWSPSYRSRYRAALCEDFPRIPLPSGEAPFRALASIGTRLCRMHLNPAPRAPGGNAGDGCCIDKVRWDEGQQRVWINHSDWLPVPREVWGLFVGNHAVCKEWLQARAGRTLQEDDLRWFGGVVRVLAETVGTGRAIDAAIEEHGGWGAAFRGAAGQKLPLT